jgi:hypothetical protein
MSHDFAILGVDAKLLALAALKTDFVKTHCRLRDLTPKLPLPRKGEPVDQSRFVWEFRNERDRDRVARIEAQIQETKKEREQLLEGTKCQLSEQ